VKTTKREALPNAVRCSMLFKSKVVKMDVLVCECLRVEKMARRRTLRSGQFFIIVISSSQSPSCPAWLKTIDIFSIFLF